MLTILPDTDPSLRTKCLPVKTVTPNLQMLVMHMFLSLREHGVGLSANQVGRKERLIIVAYKGTRRAMFNPEIIEIRGGTSNLQEGCLSAGEKLCNVERPAVIVVKYRNEIGKPRQEIFGGFTARIIQHELAHLDGRMMTDEMPHCDDVKKLLDLQAV